MPSLQVQEGTDYEDSDDPSQEMAPFLVAAVKVDGERYSPILKAYSKSKSALDEATVDALSRFDELRKMEVWKEKHCRYCPYCKRVVEKMSGCDAMQCGTDAHGGNQQQARCGATPSLWLWHWRSTHQT